MKKFLGLLLLMGQIKKSHWREYWTTDALIETPIFPQTMTRNRFEQILRFFHIADDTQSMDGANKELWIVKPLMDHFIPKFQSIYAPKQQLSMNEAIVPSTGNLRFRKHNPAKTTRYGVLLRMLSESETGYILNMEVYAGSGKPSIESITSVIQPYFGRWHHVYQDNYYNSVAMANMLYENQTLVCGIIRANRGIPTVIKDKSTALQRGEIAYVRNGPIMVLAWKNKRLINMISTVHDASMKPTRNKKRVFSSAASKPTCVLDHSKYLAGDDRTGRYLANCHVFRKTGKWYKKMTFFLINCALFNAFVLCRSHSEGKSKMRYRQFLLEVARAWIAADALPAQKVPKTKPQETKENHALEKIVTPGKERPTRKCKVCYEEGLRKETRYICKACNVPLHAYKCFENFHIALNKSSNKRNK
ncbi:piggyBac transposable element-derived protein 4 isoform X1 [Anopheles coustani]|uniref:piggyBac transposable element-derived protein 4 isoform X1 n=1 Tax=Anopheles coustani TaxID=139045 RepID=UPI0026591DC2|nr:piggyBac transposable element-derived protein 4 isoform X1 [Anopheles coustani]